MYAIVTDDHTGEEITRHALTDTDPLTPAHYADIWADSAGLSIAHGGGYVPLGCADITVTIQEEPGAVRCWNSESFFVEGE